MEQSTDLVSNSLGNIGSSTLSYTLQQTLEVAFMEKWCSHQLVQVPNNRLIKLQMKSQDSA